MALFVRSTLKTLKSMKSRDVTGAVDACGTNDARFRHVWRGIVIPDLRFTCFTG